MCGVLGMVAGPKGSEVEPWTPAEVAELMFPNIEHRGKDSFGWIHRRGDTGAIQLRKFAEPATKGIGKVKADHRFGIPNDATWWIGHVRLATHGTAKYTHNNHPIVHGDIMGVHNGICYNYNSILRDTGRQHKKAEVDSEAIFAAIHKYGVVEGLDKLDALAATVFVNRNEPDKIYFATCDANPLIIARSKTGATYFASESWILEALGIEWEEEPWKMADYSLYIMKAGVEESYVQYADPTEKSRKGMGKSYSYSGYGGGYTNMYDDYHSGIGRGSYGRRIETSSLTGSHAWDEEDMVWYDTQTGKQGSGPLDEGSELGSESLSADLEPDVECLDCNWSGDDWDADDGLCPRCGKAEYLVPFGILNEGTKEIVQNQIYIDDQEEWLKTFVEGLKKDDLVVVSGGKVIPLDQYDDYKIAEKIFKL